MGSPIEDLNAALDLALEAARRAYLGPIEIHILRVGVGHSETLHKFPEHNDPTKPSPFEIEQWGRGHSIEVIKSLRLRIPGLIDLREAKDLAHRWQDEGLLPTQPEPDFRGR
jgi:hypothetical protein